jgi:hypothetical protein
LGTIPAAHAATEWIYAKVLVCIAEGTRDKINPFLGLGTASSLNKNIGIQIEYNNFGKAGDDYTGHMNNLDSIMGGISGNLFTICREKPSAGWSAAQKPQCRVIHEDFEPRMSPDHGFAVRSWTGSYHF